MPLLRRFVNRASSCEAQLVSKPPESPMTSSIRRPDFPRKASADAIGSAKKVPEFSTLATRRSRVDLKLFRSDPRSSIDRFVAGDGLQISIAGRFGRTPRSLFNASSIGFAGVAGLV